MVTVEEASTRVADHTAAPTSSRTRLRRVLLGVALHGGLALLVLAVVWGLPPRQPHALPSRMPARPAPSRTAEELFPNIQPGQRVWFHKGSFDASYEHAGLVLERTADQFLVDNGTYRWWLRYPQDKIWLLDAEN